MLAALILVAGIGIYVFTGIKNGAVTFSGIKPVEEMSSYGKGTITGKWAEGDVEYNGGTYRYNRWIKTYLLMGVDKSGPVTKGVDYLDGGQTDAMFLLVSDDKNKKISIIPINRNTMTAVMMCDREGNDIGKFKLQICLQHGYGDGLRNSCQRTVQTVSDLFGGIPIAGYVAMNMDGMYILNSLAGGVEVEVLEDVTNPELGVNLKKGEKKLLNDQEAYAYLRYRTKEFAAANLRLDREKQYLPGLFDNLNEKAAGDEKAAMNMYDMVEDYIVTNVQFDRIVEDLMEYGFDENNMYEIPGETMMGKNFEQFFVDKEGLHDIIMQVLYESV